MTPTQRLDVNGKIRMRAQTDSGDTADTVATKGYVDSKIGGGSGTGVWGEWKEVSSIRQENVSYHNATGGPMMVAVTDNHGNLFTYEVSKDGINWVIVGRIGANSEHSFSFVVPPDNYYRVHSWN